MKSNKTEKVRESLFLDILRGRYSPGDRVPTERDMSVQAGVGRITVRRAYAELEAEGILERTQGRGTFISTVAKGNESGLKLVALMAPMGDPFLMEFAVALEAALARRQSLMVLKITDEVDSLEEKAVLELVAGGVRDMVVWPKGSGFPAETFQRVRILGMNMVFFDRLLPGSVADFVGLDNEHAVTSLLEKAAADGFKKFRMLCFEGIEADSVKEREAAFVKACEKSGVAPDVVRVQWGKDIGKKLFAKRSEWLPDGKERVAIVCENDVLGLAAKEICGSSEGIYSVDGMPQAVAEGITTYRQPVAEMAEEAVKLLQAQSRKGALWKPKVSRLKGELL